MHRKILKIARNGMYVFIAATSSVFSCPNSDDDGSESISNRQPDNVFTIKYNVGDGVLM